jgi:hypothetical protein
MSAHRPQESTVSTALSSALPPGDAGNITLELNGAMGAIFNCTADSSATGLVKVQFVSGGTWYVWKSYQYDPDVPAFTTREANTTITLDTNDTLFVEAPGAYAVQFDLGGTSATVYARTCETIAGLLASQGIGAGSNGGGGTSDPTLISIRVLDSDGAQANVAMVTVSAGTQIGVTSYVIRMDGSNTGPVNATLGFAAATLATPNTTTGAGIIADFQGCSAGQGEARGDGSAVLGWGASGEDLRYTMEDPAGGAGTISATYVTRATA